MKKKKLSNEKQTTLGITERLAEQKENLSTWKEMLPFGKFVDGKNTLEIDTSVPIVKQKSKFGEQILYTGTLNGEKVKVALPMSVEIPVLKGLAKKKIAFTINKKGSGMKTRYSVE